MSDVVDSIARPGSVGVDLEIDTTEFDAAVQYAKDKAESVVRCPGPPPLMIFADRKMSCDEHALFREAFRDSNLIVVTPGFAVFQCVDGRWQQIKPEGE